MAAVGLWLADDLPARGVVLVSLAGVAAACLAVAAMTFSTRIAALLVGVLGLLPWGRLQRGGAAVVTAVQHYARHHGVLSAVLAASFGVQILRIVQAWCLGLALGITAPLATYFAYIPLVLLVMLLPITINGLGTSQAAFVLFFERAGVARPEAFALSVLFVALGVVGNLPGGLLYAWRGAGIAPARGSAPRPLS
jgi:hypothetical protein